MVIAIIVNACGQKNSNINQSELKMNSVENNNPYYSHTDTSKLVLADAEWKKILPKDLYETSRHAATERAFTGKYWNADLKGTYYCAACGRMLFRSEAKFASTCGWPSFFEQDDPHSTILKRDSSFGMERTEVLCGRCGGHLGHLFDDGPLPTGKRYCMNSIAMDFIPDGK
jgi:methionine-R-sulfoxide reductase